MSTISRRDFLKISSTAAPLAFSNRTASRQQAERQNVLILLFDAWTAANIQLFGYPRETMPNLARLVETATVYHQHRAGGSYTTPGTASLLTGTLPWTHHALQIGNRVRPSLAGHNIFAAFNSYHRIAAAQNPLANEFLLQFRDQIDDLLPFSELFIQHDPITSDWFVNDRPNALVFRTLGLENRNGRGNLLLLPILFRMYKEQIDARIQTQYGDQFPFGVPFLSNNTNYFMLEDVISKISLRLAGAPQPFFGYFHLWPPHTPYRPSQRQSGRFSDDGVEFTEKPDFPFHQDVPKSRLDGERRVYDEYMGYVDEQFAALFANLERRGILENTILVLTADHGELFERGVLTHFTASLHDPVMHIPLVIWQPGQNERVDILSPTSAVDVLPTLLHLTNHPVPEWVEGQLLRPFATGLPDLTRPVITVDAKGTPRERRLETVSLAMIRWPYKLHVYRGYRPKEADLVELYDIEKDPEELIDLSQSQPTLVEALREELLYGLDHANQNYQ